jgi:hypothetical protein
MTMMPKTIKKPKYRRVGPPVNIAHRARQRGSTT